MALPKQQVVAEATAALKGGKEGIARHRAERLARLVAHAREHSAYHRQRLAHLPRNVTDVRTLPVLTKQDLMAHFDAIVTDPSIKLADVEAFIADKSLAGQQYQGKHYVFNTSGTTGKPAYFLHDVDAMTTYHALTEARGWPLWIDPQGLAGLQKNAGRIAVLAATGGHFGGQGIVEFGRRQLPNPDAVRLFDVKAALHDLVARLNAFQPAIGSGYATAWLVMAEEQLAGRLRIQPSYVLSGAETLRPDMLRTMQEAWPGVKVRDVYAASECFGMAFDCGSGWLHVNEDYAILEPVDAHHHPVPGGTTGATTLLTNLSNFLFPLLRYDIGDRLTPLGQDCRCGSPLPAVKVEGRTDDILVAKARDGKAIPLMPKAIGAVIEESAGLAKYQLLQVAPDALEVRIEPGPGVDRAACWGTVQQRLQAYLHAQGLDNVQVGLAKEAPQRDPRSGKFLHAWAVPGVKGWHRA
jgi:phenylacetate-CoA ligase